MVLNTLQYPATVGSTIDCLVYYSAGQDFDVAAPNTVSQVPFVPQCGDFMSDVFPQSGDKLNTKVAGVIGNDSSTISMVEEFSIGEKFRSLKQLLARYSRVYSSVAAFDTTVAFRVYPWAAALVRTGTPLQKGAMIGDMYSYLAPGFALARGGMKMSINTANSVMSAVDFSRGVFDLMEASGTPFTFQLGGATLPNSFANGSASTSNLYVYPGATLATGTTNTANPALFVQSTNGIDVSMPQYTNNPSRVIPYDVVPQVLSGIYDYAIAPRTALQWDSMSTVTGKKMYRSMGEDGQLGYFIGFPPSIITVT